MKGGSVTAFLPRACLLGWPTRPRHLHRQAAGPCGGARSAGGGSPPLHPRPAAPDPPDHIGFVTAFLPRACLLGWPTRPVIFTAKQRDRAAELDGRAAALLLCIHDQSSPIFTDNFPVGGGLLRFGGGFRGYGGSGGGEESRWGSGRGFSDEPRRGGGVEQDLGPSRADEADNWGAGKRTAPLLPSRGRMFESSSRADDSESWVTNRGSPA